MALIGVSRSETFDYVSEHDPCRVTIEVPIDPENPEKGTRTEVDIAASEERGATIFKLSVLDVFLMGMIYDKTTSVTRTDDDAGVGIQTKINQANIEATRFGLRGWRNFQNREREQLEFLTEEKSLGARNYVVASDISLNRLGIRLVRELGQEIKQRSEVSGREAKNFVTA